MKIRKRSSLVRFFAGEEHPVDASSPEFRFMKAVCDGDTKHVLSLFRDEKLFGKKKKSAVDAPYGRFEGLSGIREFSQAFWPAFMRPRRLWYRLYKQ